MTTENNILLLEDDISLVDGLHYSLTKNGFVVEVARTVKEAMTLVAKKKYALLLLDLSLPDGTGFEVCEWVRQRDSVTPIIFLTAADEELSVVRGLDSGGDDYITKPFKLGELHSRIKALLRRSGVRNAQEANSMVSGDISIDFLANRVLLRDKALELTSTEYRLLCLLVKNAGSVVTRKIILDKLWDSTGCFVDDNTLSVSIRRLREKIELDPSNPKHLVTLRGFGYEWREASK